MSTGIIILAAGNSSRLGQPKQLLTFKGKGLLEIAAEAAITTSIRPIIVVLGANAGIILKSTSYPEISYLVNEHWHEGMSSSIALGITTIKDRYPDLENVIIAVSDQAYMNPEILEGLLSKKESSGKNIVASRYNETTGSPALFNKKYFTQLNALKGDKGAKQILEEHPEDIATVKFELGQIDIDTKTDYENLINHK